LNLRGKFPIDRLRAPGAKRHRCSVHELDGARIQNPAGANKKNPRFCHSDMPKSKRMAKSSILHKTPIFLEHFYAGNTQLTPMTAALLTCHDLPLHIHGVLLYIRPQVKARHPLAQYLYTFKAIANARSETDGIATLLQPHCHTFTHTRQELS
jgi:hypothetical protein